MNGSATCQNVAFLRNSGEKSLPPAVQCSLSTSGSGSLHLPTEQVRFIQAATSSQAAEVNTLQAHAKLPLPLFHFLFLTGFSENGESHGLPLESPCCFSHINSPTPRSPVPTFSSSRDGRARIHHSVSFSDSLMLLPYPPPPKTLPLG